MDSLEAAGLKQSSLNGSSSLNSKMEVCLYVDPVMVSKPTLGDDQVMIKIAAIGLNNNDRLSLYDFFGSVYGRHPPNLYLSNECSGVVVAVGSKVSNFKVGDKVCAIPMHGNYKHPQFVLVPQSHVLQIPSKVTVAAAAALPQASCLSFYALSILTKANLCKTVMIHGAAGGVGIIALQYARHVGCKVFAVAGTEERLQLCKTMGAEVCINHRKEDFRKRVMAETGGKGVDIILDVNGEKYLEENLKCLAMGGSLVILGLKGGSSAFFDITILGEKDLTVIGADLRNLSFERLGSLLCDVEAMFWPLINAGHISPIIGKIFKFSAVIEALEALRLYRYPGKLLLTSF